MSLPVSQAFELEVSGFAIITEARLVCADTFSGVFHVLSESGQQIFQPPVVVLVPGKWEQERDAHRAAKDYAAVMAANGALHAAIRLRLCFCR